jgi:amino-acid N-acetyltransferase
MNAQPDQFDIRLARTGEQEKIYALLTENHLPTDGLSEHVHSLLVASHEDAIVGSAGLEVYGKAALLRSVAVAPERQGEGLGHKLTEAALVFAKQQGIEEIYLLTETAAAFFPRFGFVPSTRAEVPDAVKQSVEFTTACPQSALVMKLPLA